MKYTDCTSLYKGKEVGWSGETDFRGKLFSAMGKTKKDVEDKLCQKMVNYMKDQGMYVEKTKKTKRGGKKDRPYLQLLRDSFILKHCIATKMCPVCKYKNFPRDKGMVSYTNCNRCGEDIREVKEQEEKLIFIDIERVTGRLESHPLSVGLVAIGGDRGDVLEKKELVILPPDGVKVDKWCTLNVHRMYIQGRGASRKVMKLGDTYEEKENILPSVSPAVAARQIVDFLRAHGADTILCHGQDMKCIDPFMARQGLEADFMECTKFVVDTGEFFKNVQSEIGERKFSMKAITHEYGWKSLQDVYQTGAHGAQVDAYVLAQLCCSGHSKLRIRFAVWLSTSRWLRR